MKESHARKMITAGVLSLFLFSSLCLGLSGAAQAQGTIVKVEPYRFNDVFDNFLSNFQINFPKKPPSPPEKDEFETTREYEARKSKWEKEHEKAVADYRKKSSKTVPVFELHDLEFTFGRYNADKGCFSKITSSRFNAVDVNPVCKGYQIDASCPFGPMDRYAEIIIRGKRAEGQHFPIKNARGTQAHPPLPRKISEKTKISFSPCIHLRYHNRQNSSHHN
jgi:hypothetical protein